MFWREKTAQGNPEDPGWHSADPTNPGYHIKVQPPTDGTEFLAWYDGDMVQILRRVWVNRDNQPYSDPHYWRPLPK